MSVPIQEVLSTDRDAPLLVVNGFTYHNQNAGNVKVTWRCTIKGCKAYVATYRDWELSMVAAERGAHLHLPDPLSCLYCYETPLCMYVHCSVKEKFMYVAIHSSHCNAIRIGC